MAVVSAEVRFAPQLTAWFTANPTKVLQNGEIVYCSDGANVGKYVIGDNSTQLSALTFYGGISASGLTVGTTTITGGTTTRVLYNNAGVVGEYAVSGTGSVLMTSTIGSTVQGYSASTTLLGNSTTGSGSNIVLGTSPTFVTDITTPIVYGSSASGGNLTIQSTSNATKGSIFHGATTTDTKHVFYVGTGASAIQIRSLVGTLSQSAIYVGVAPGSETANNYAFNWDGSLAINAQATSSAIDFRQGGSSRLTIYGAATSSSNPHWLINFPTSTGITASTETPDILVNSKTKTWAGGNISIQRGLHWKTQTYAFTSASTVTTAYGLYVEAATAGTNATITNNFAIGTNGSISIAGSGNIVFSGFQTNALITNITGGNLRLACGVNAALNFDLGVAGNAAVQYLAATSSGATNAYIHTAASNTNQTASTEINGTLYNSYSRQWATGAITTQRERYYKTVTYTAVGASTITNAYGAYFEAPTASTNVTITNNYALGTNGKAKFGGNVELTQTVTTEALVSDTSVTIVINGVTYKLLAKA